MTFRFYEEDNRTRVDPEADGILLRTPKDDNFIAALKAVAPWPFREWRPAETAWFVDMNYAESAVGLFLTFFPDGYIHPEVREEYLHG